MTNTETAVLALAENAHTKCPGRITIEHQNRTGDHYPVSCSCGWTDRFSGKTVAVALESRTISCSFCSRPGFQEKAFDRDWRGHVAGVGAVHPEDYQCGEVLCGACHTTAQKATYASGRGYSEAVEVMRSLMPSGFAGATFEKALRDAVKTDSRLTESEIGVMIRGPERQAQLDGVHCAAVESLLQERHPGCHEDIRVNELVVMNWQERRLGSHDQHVKSIIECECGASFEFSHEEIRERIKAQTNAAVDDAVEIIAHSFPTPPLPNKAERAQAIERANESFTINRIEVNHCDPDRFVHGMMEALKRNAERPVSSFMQNYEQVDEATRELERSARMAMDGAGLRDPGFAAVGLEAVQPSYENSAFIYGAIQAEPEWPPGTRQQFNGVMQALDEVGASTPIRALVRGLLVDLAEATRELNQKDEQLKNGREVVDGRQDDLVRIGKALELYPSIAGPVTTEAILTRIARLRRERGDNEAALRAEIAELKRDREVLGHLRVVLERTRNDLDAMTNRSSEYRRERDAHRKTLNKIADSLGVVHEDAKIGKAVSELQQENAEFFVEAKDAKAQAACRHHKLAPHRREGNKLVDRCAECGYEEWRHSILLEGASPSAVAQAPDVRPQIVVDGEE